MCRCVLFPQLSSGQNTNEVLSHLKLKLAIFLPEYIFIAILNNTPHIVVLSTFIVLGCEYCQLYCEYIFVNTGANEILHSRPAFIRGLVIFDCFFIFVSFFLILTLNYYCLLYINLFWNDSSFHKHVNYVSIRDKRIYDKICCLFD